MSGGQALVQDIAHFRLRVLQEALDNASRSYWLRRAAEFDGVGTPTADATAQACRNRATLAPLDDWPELLEVLAEREAADDVA
ncbi:MAG TPA: hypothetical protein VGK78_14675 [Nocardioides sp.]|uniref:hypothetical protein n=1 Tax=Nocardioides sp. TaxID=35761 RepID=UPI002F3F4850